MTVTDNKPAEASAKDFTGTWRYKIGLFMILVGNAVVIFAPIILPFLGVSIGIIGAIVLCGEVFATGSIVILGKEGFKAIKNKISGVMKAGYTAAVGKTRHTIGITLFCLHAVSAYIIAAYAWIVFGRTTPENPFPEVWGLSFEGQETMLLWVFFVGEITFLVSLYVLGAEWWGRFRNIFVWKPSEN